MNRSDQNRLNEFQTDHLILLVGTNPLPNYVAARLLCPTGEVHLLCSAETKELAEKRLQKKILNGQVVAVLSESTPQDIYTQTRQLVKKLKGTVGLHYTGGTKAMSVHAYRAVKEIKPDAICSYLDARDCNLVVDARVAGDQDTRIPVLFEPAVQMTVASLMELHNIHLSSQPLQAPLLYEISRVLQQYFERDRTWHEWCTKNLLRDANSREFHSASKLKGLVPPKEQFSELCEEFEKMGAPETNATLEDWTKTSSHFNGDTKKLAKRIEGGFWLESISLKALLSIKDECHLTDCGMNYEVPGNDYPNSKFEFDVATTRGYQLFAITCTTDKKDSLCKSKLFEAFARAKQMGGEEARVALVCYHPDPDKILSDFKNENYDAKGIVTVFGKPHIPDLAANLRAWINQ
jgi:hypothetical protein